MDICIAIHFTMPKNLLSLLLSLFTISAFAQLDAWQNKLALEIDYQGTSDKTNYTLLLEVNTQDLIANGGMAADGKDIRISTSCTGDEVLAHWVESGINTPNTKIWCLMPSLSGNTKDTLYLFYNNAAATNTSDFDAAFPSQLKIETTDTLMGLITDSVWTYNYIYIAKDVLVKFDPTLTLPWKLRMDASKIEIEGTLMGKGMGFPGVINGNGQGPGGGTQEITGGGGGAYGGNGGFGSYGSNPDSRGLGGTAYGTKNGFDIQAGSAGGAAGLVGGGNPGAPGGIAYKIEAIDVKITGNLNAEGVNGTNTEVSYSPGGGAGGGILINTQYFSGNGKLLAKGGNGGNSETIYYAGGGAGGGRIKLFYSKANNFTGSTNVKGGFRGLGGITPGEDGEDGTVHDSLISPSIAVTPLTQAAAINLLSPNTCEGQNIVFEPSATADNYSFFVDGKQVQTGSNNQYTYNANAGNYNIYAVLSVGGCELNTSNLNFTVYPEPQPLISSDKDAFCPGDSILVNANVGGASSFVWELNGATLNKDDVASFHLKSEGTLSLIETDANGCEGVIEKEIEEFSTPSPGIDVGSLQICEGDSTQFYIDPGFASVKIFKDGSLFSTNPGVYIKEAGTYTTEMTSTEGCVVEGHTDIIISVLDTPEVQINATGGLLLCDGVNQELNLSGLQGENVEWFKNQNLISGENDASLSIESAGNYYAVITNSDNCSVQTNTSSYEAFPKPESNFELDQDFCQGDSTILSTADTELNISWNVNGSDAGSTQEITVYKSGYAILTLSNAEGCSNSSDTAFFNAFKLPSASITSEEGKDSFCEGTSLMLSNNFDGQATWIFEGTNSGNISSNFTAEEAGNYWLELVDNNGCKNNSDTLTLSTIEAPLALEIDAIGDSLFTRIEVGSYQWFLEGNAIANATQFFHIATENGNYSATITSEEGCVSEPSESYNYQAVGINEWQEKMIELYPNPNEGIANIAAKESFTWRLLDLSGKEIQVGNANQGKASIEIVTSGSYVLRLDFKDGSSTYRKLIKR